MELYISKADVVAEIQERIDETESMRPAFDQFWAGQISAFNGVLKILDTLEMKEVDLEREVNEYMVNEMKFLSDEVGYDTLSTIAKHFFELGLKAQKGE